MKILVTGATGVTGANICRIACTTGHQVRGLVRSKKDRKILEEMGVKTVVGDITDRASLSAAMRGVDYVIHGAALIGGTWSTHTPEEMDRVNLGGAVNVLDLAQEHGIKRTAMISTLAILNNSRTLSEDSGILPIGDSDSPYVKAKRAAYYESMARACRGQDIVTVIPGGIYGPSPFVERALHPTCFNSTLLNGARGELKRYLSAKMPWVFADDVANIALLALEKGATGRAYIAAGDSLDTMSLPAFCNRFAEICGMSGRVKEIDLDHLGAEQEKEFGTMVAIMRRLAAVNPVFDSSATNRALGFTPTRVQDGLSATCEWMRTKGLL